ncbi:MAG: potassium transporter KtrB [Rhodopirellula sp.]|nr:potassium transporter KtrB [Rhodopirellula sp.]
METQKAFWLRKRKPAWFRFIEHVVSICRVRARWLRSRLARLDTIRLLVLGYLSYVLIGWGMLCLPVSHQIDGLHWLDHFFIAASAVSTTGLTTISTSESYSWFGEFVVLMLIQFGGLGYMTISSFTVLAVAGELSPLRNRVSQATLTLPRGFEVRQFLRIIFWFTLAIETVGAVALYPSFVAHGVIQPVWQAIFHSISAFCTAGFGLFSNSLEDYRDDIWMNFVITVLSYSGAIGFIVLHDVWLTARQRKPHITLTSKVILWSTFWISAIGTALFAFGEPTVSTMSPVQRWMASLFQVMSASTTVGFNSIPIGPLSGSSLYLLTVVMVIGASPSGTGGGLKTTTFSALWAEMVSVLRRRDVTVFLGKAIPGLRMRTAVANIMFYSLTLAAGIYLLALVEPSPLPDQMFECASALGTVGLSRGITGSLSMTGKWIIIGLMFVGRVGPVILGMAFFDPPKETPSSSEEDVAI